MKTYTVTIVDVIHLEKTIELIAPNKKAANEYARNMQEYGKLDHLDWTETGIKCGKSIVRVKK